MTEPPFIQSVRLCRGEVPNFDAYPFSIPAVRQLDELRLDPRVTIFVGENGSGKSTLVEAIAVAAGFNPEGGGARMRFQTRPSHSPLHEFLTVVRSYRTPKLLPRGSGAFPSPLTRVRRAEAMWTCAWREEDYGQLKRLRISRAAGRLDSQTMTSCAIAGDTPGPA
jgi:energy-coupling factor transporter ATP-binding protein EcfA2